MEGETEVVETSPPAPAGGQTDVEESSSNVDEETSLPEEPVSYPLHVVYCGNCGLPPEYCEYYPDAENCRKWLEANLPSGMEGVCYQLLYPVCKNARCRINC